MARWLVVDDASPVVECAKVFAGDEKLTTALLDRLAHHATVVLTKGKSFRMRKRASTDDESARPAQDQSPPRSPKSAPKA